MRSSSGEHYIALDHVRALAAFLVFAWHFVHAGTGYPVPFNYVPAVFPLVLLDEGHTGVSLFMTLSGYLFAKLLAGRTINYGAFFWNRFLRLTPLLVVVALIAGLKSYLQGQPISDYLVSLVCGFVLPTWPGGGWSITVEIHFYLLLPALLALHRKSGLLLLGVVAVMFLFRVFLRSQFMEVQTFAYWSIIGRMDQFVLGIFAFHFRHLIIGRHWHAGLAAVGFLLFYLAFDQLGGFYNNPTYPSPSFIWVALPTIEGAAYGMFIAYYEGSFAITQGPVSRFIGRIGVYSYSIYLLHSFIVTRMAAFVQTRIMDITGFYAATFWALVGFLVMIPIAGCSYRFIEKPFLTLRRRYVSAEPASAGAFPIDSSRSRSL